MLSKVQIDRSLLVEGATVVWRDNVGVVGEGVVWQYFPKIDTIQVHVQGEETVIYVDARLVTAVIQPFKSVVAARDAMTTALRYIESGYMNSEAREAARQLRVALGLPPTP